MVTTKVKTKSFRQLMKKRLTPEEIKQIEERALLEARALKARALRAL